MCTDVVVCTLDKHTDIACILGKREHVCTYLSLILYIYILSVSKEFLSILASVNN